MPPKGAVDGSTPKNHLHCRTSTDWSMGSVSDGRLVDSTNSPEENFPRELQETSDESIEKLKSELSNLMRQSELSELELQSLRRQITKESRRGRICQDMLRNLKRREMHSKQNQNWNYSLFGNRLQRRAEGGRICQEMLRDLKRREMHSKQNVNNSSAQMKENP
jgi:DNA repair exonuclease SbcCD nuclease subunit